MNVIPSCSERFSNPINPKRKKKINHKCLKISKSIRKPSHLREVTELYIEK